MLLTTDESTALSIREPVTMAEFVYFQQHDETEWIRIGFTGANGRREHAQHDFTVIAMIQGCYDDEQRLEKGGWFEPAGRRGDISTFKGQAIYDYVIWLLERNHAGRDRSEAERMPMLPWSVWGPPAQRNEGRNGELSLFAALPQRERIKVARSDLAHLSSESDDWYTPADLIEAARAAMGSIDLDPATCVTAQRQIRATLWYTKAQDGLRTDLPWKGNVWLNPPYGRGESSAAAFIQRLLRELGTGHVTQAVTCLNLASSCALWFEPIWDAAPVHLICRGRPNFWNDQHQNSSPTKGTILSYFGSRPGAFMSAFGSFGHIVTRQKAA